MTTATLETTGDVECVHLADGRLVRLAGALGDAQTARLRDALLTPLPPQCRDVVVEAGDVTAIDDCALAVLLAGRVWAEDTGARFVLSRTATALDDSLDQLGLADALPRLAPLAPRPGGPVVAPLRPAVE